MAGSEGNRCLPAESGREGGRVEREDREGGMEGGRKGGREGGMEGGRERGGVHCPPSMDTTSTQKKFHLFLLHKPLARPTYILPHPSHNFNSKLNSQVTTSTQR